LFCMMMVLPRQHMHVTFSQEEEGTPMDDVKGD
jgi:hypothetical protein